MGTKKLRLCFLTRDYALQPPFGGVATYVRQAAQWLAIEGHDIQVVCVDRHRTPHMSQDGQVKVHFVGPKRIRPRSLVRLAAILPGLHSLHEAYSGWDLLENSLGGWSMVDKLARTTPFDLVECDDYEGKAFWGLWPRHRYRILLRGHGIIHLGLPFARYPGARFHHQLEALCADRADFILTAAEYLADAYRAELDLKHNRIASLALPFDVSKVTQGSEAKEMTVGQLTALYVGRLHHLKGTDLLFEGLLQAREQCSQLRCVLVGAPEAEFAAHLARFLAANSGWVTHAGALPQNQVFEQMAQADILVFPSRTETLPRVLIEAQALGLPQIATRVGGIPEIVEDGLTGLLIPGDDAPALAHAIVRLCLDHDLRARMASASRKRAASKYDLNQVMTQQMDVYRAISGGGIPTGGPL